MEKIVCKFGGTSLADAHQIRKVCAIVKSDARRRFVVVSAPGKRNKDDAKITDLLLTCWHLATQKLAYSEPLQLIRARYDEIARDLEIAPLTYPLDDIESELEKLARGDASTLASRDWMAARGEFCHALLVADFLGATFVPSGECIRFDEEGQLDPISYLNLSARLSDPDALYVVPGFYGRDTAGRIKTFPRGGSDITGAVVARAIGAEIYENWTDVSGLLMADPRVVENPRSIAEVTYRELRELAYMGASVLHEETIFPASQAGIPIQIKNTNAPNDIGTRIVASRDAGEGGVVGIAGRTGFSTIFIEKAMMNQSRGFGRRVLEILETNGVSFEHMPSGIDSMSVIISDENFEGNEAAILRELTRTLEPDRIELLPKMALIATVGEGMAYRVGISGQLFDALRAAHVNVRMISQGASEINIIVGVSEEDYQRAVSAIYHAFVA
ncbi:aspartate kinase [Abditibacterium utsteinense]|uniref:Aspartokinase n=1 Tax=Abditibacterium utsteinense TaxID=1960156 RepID=A0A2S8SRI8_9BACT|nr:aspartate kinase [Abditibacterium utsteinense]PQV63410.1 aspartate kinase [Abditibacterium utsteinense]